MSLEIVTVATKPYFDQKPGTSGLRKKVKHVREANYLENFVQSLFDVVQVKDQVLVLSGDGRYYNADASVLIMRMAAAAGVKKIIVGVNFLMSTPCVSAVIRESKSYGGIVLTASHNPGGPDEDFGIKYNTANGGPANEDITNAIYEKSKEITQYFITKESPKFDFSSPARYTFGPMEIEVIDGPARYANTMKDIFDFSGLKSFIAKHSKNFAFVYDSMHGVAGPFAKEIFVNQLGFSPDALINR